MTYKGWLFFALALFISVSASAQTKASANSSLAWDQDASSLQEVQSFTFMYYADGATTGLALAGVVCVGNPPTFQCTSPFPAFTPGNHDVQITASNNFSESLKSNNLSFLFGVIPTAPKSLRIAVAP